jgi:trehalose-6-phosphate synthase
VLSERAGSYEELVDGALGIPPEDVDATAAALDQALRMSATERKERATRLRRAILAHQVEDWLALLLRDMMHEVPEAAGAPEVAV